MSSHAVLKGVQAVLSSTLNGHTSMSPGSGCSVCGETAKFCGPMGCNQAGDTRQRERSSGREVFGQCRNAVRGMCVNAWIQVQYPPVDFLWCLVLTSEERMGLEDVAF